MWPAGRAMELYLTGARLNVRARLFLFVTAAPGYRSEEEFQGELDYAGVFARLLNLAEGQIAEVAVGIGELRMVPGIVKLGAELRGPALPDGRVFYEGDVRVADRRPAAE